MYRRDGSTWSIPLTSIRRSKTRVAVLAQSRKAACGARPPDMAAPWLRTGAPMPMRAAAPTVVFIHGQKPSTSKAPSR
jgi:hypothetical protein